MSLNNLSTRIDLRCEMCRQKHAFLCEHDTPYRDQYLEIYNTNVEQNKQITGRRAKSETRISNNSMTNGGIKSLGQLYSGIGASNQPKKNVNNNHVKEKTSNQPSKTNPSNKNVDNSHVKDKTLTQPSKPNASNKNLDKNHAAKNNTPNQPSKTNDPPQKAKGCVIL